MRKAVTTTPEKNYVNGKWVTEAAYANVTGLHRQTLTNWRFRDRKAARTGPEPGFPEYRYFGGAVRYWLPSEILNPDSAPPAEQTLKLADSLNGVVADAVKEETSYLIARSAE